jgi:hypothetical protein
MATSWSLEQATPHSLAFIVTGGAGPDTKTPQSATVPGPLRTLLRKLDAAGTMDQLNLDGALNGRVRIRHIEGSSLAQRTPTTRTFTWNAHDLTIDAPPNSVSQIEIRFEHSFKR